MNYIFRLFAIVIWFCKLALSLIFITLIFGMFSGKLVIAKNSFFQKIKVIDHQLIYLTKIYLPTEYNHQDISRYVALGVVLVLIVIFKSLYSECLYRYSYFETQREAKRLAKLMGQSHGKNKNLEAINQKFTQLESASRQDRKQLLKEFVDIKKQLESMGKELAFLSIDVVDSTGMKQGEDPYVVTHNFNEYRSFVETRINANGCIKSTWTPDGLMACFTKLDDAIKTAQILLRDLVYFNKGVKSMKRDFMIRCGVNAGYLFFDDSLPLEQITDRVIDIAGHMQKHAEPNTIFIAKQVIKPVDYMKGFIETDINIDGLNAYRWDETAKREGE